MASYAWTTAFDEPAPPTGLVLATDEPALVATVDASADPYHFEYIWEAQFDDRGWVEIGRTADPEMDYILAPFNSDVRVRVSDSIGALPISDSIEAVGQVMVARWWMAHTAGDETFTQELRYVRPQGTVEVPLDQTIMQPLSGPDGDLQPPIVVTGQYQGERLSLALQIKPDDAFLIGVLQRAARLAPGAIALKDPKGPVYIAQLGGMRITDLGAGHRQVDLGAIRVA